MANIKKIQASLIRGGTSKGLFFSEHLPDQLLALALGSPDETSMQLDGVGGGITSTSKIAIVTPRPGDLDVDYLFGQVDLSSGRVDWSGSCGNLVAAVGIYARESGLVSPEKRTISILYIGGGPTARFWISILEYLVTTSSALEYIRKSYYLSLSLFIHA